MADGHNPHAAPASPPPHPDGLPERWAPIDGFPGYLVSDLGRVWSQPRRVRAPHGHMRDAGGALLTWQFGSHGYPMAPLYGGGKRTARRLLVHRLVAAAFCPRPEGADIVHHVSHNKCDPRAANLVWVTRSQNAKAAMDAGRMAGQLGSAAPLKLSEAQVRAARAAVDLGVPRKSVAAALGVSYAHVLRLAARRTRQSAGEPTPADKASARAFAAALDAGEAPERAAHLLPPPPDAPARHVISKLSEAEVLGIREAFAAGAATAAEQAQRFGVTRAAIDAILSGRNWRHVGGDALVAACRARLDREAVRRGAAGLSEAQVLAIRKAFAAGEATVAELARRFDATRDAIRAILSGRSRAHVGGGELVAACGARLEREAGPPRGAWHPRARLTEADVRAIRAAWAAGGVRQRELAERHGVSRETIKNVVTRYR